MRQYQVDIEVDSPLPQSAHETIRQAVVVTLNRETMLSDAALTILLTDDHRIQELNSQYRGEDKPTDVLSFPVGDSTPGTDGYLGDIVISVPKAEKQAKDNGYPLEVELQLLTVHAVLHLLGYDHSSSAEKAVMWRSQLAALADLGIEYASPE